MENKLHVKNLTISFRTSNGKVQAVRGIDFDLAKGETLAIVGESGSGKSVTSKAILGILAGNSIIEGGEIVYDGKDLLKIPEEEFHKIRGDKIAMIFQDPMSSLNPIIKIGKQLTEAMLLKGKARQKESSRTFDAYLKTLNRRMIDALAKEQPEKAKELTKKCKDFDLFEKKHQTLEVVYNRAHQAASDALPEIETILFEIEKNAFNEPIERIKNVKKLALDSINEWVVTGAQAGEIRTATETLVNDTAYAKKHGVWTVVVESLKIIQRVLKEAMDFEQPNFFSMGYYLTFSGEKEIPKLESVSKLNAFLRKYLDEHFMFSFIDDAKAAIEYSAEASYKEMLEAVICLKKYRPVFEAAKLNKKTAMETHQILAKEIMETVDPLNIVKDSMVYTFGTGLKSEIETYFNAIVKNESEAKRYQKQKAEYDRIVAKGKVPNGEVIPASITDLELVKSNILSQIDRMIAHFEKMVQEKSSRDYHAETIALIDFLKANASGVVNKITKSMAKAKAIKLMKEVGIKNPRKRYNQYPFEFSGGMRQRIVIAIALAADPDILICDEPTTALDVTIQSQILELINKLKEERKLSIIFITHDLGVVANMADRIAVMYAGKIVEYGTAEDIFYRAAHPYTWALLSSMPDLDTNEKLDAIPGTPPNMIYPPVGDAFAPRNKYAMQIDFERQPPMFKISDSHHAATCLLHPDAPKIDPPKTITDRIKRMKERRGES